MRYADAAFAAMIRFAAYAATPRYAMILRQL